MSILFDLSLFAVSASNGACAERWLETRIAGQPAGYIHVETQTVGDSFVTSGESRTVMNRLGSKVEITGKTRTEETAQGDVIELSTEISSSLQKTLTEGRVAGHALVLKISTGGKAYERKIELTEPLTGPDGARRLTLNRLRGKGDQVSYASFSPELGAVNRITVTCKSRSPSGMQVEETSTGLPGSSTVWLDEAGRILRRVQASPFGEIEIRVATKEQALATTQTGAELPAESFRKSLVRSNIRLPHERELDQIRVRIRHLNPSLGWPEFTDDRQTVISKSNDEVVLEVRRRPKELQPSPPAEFLAPNALFQSDDQAVVSIAKEIASRGGDLFSLRDWTHENMRFDPGIAVAPASEVVRNRAGTCFGYSVLLGALARAAGMPSRMKIGFAYTGGVWGGHAWIEAFRDGEWVAVDAALVSLRHADAARISFFSTSLAEGAIAGLRDLARMYGNVSIEILEYSVNGKVTALPKNVQRIR